MPIFWYNLSMGERDFRYGKLPLPVGKSDYAASLEAEGITDIMKFGYAFFSKKSAICR